MLLEIETVGKRYAGIEALRAVTLHVPAGGIYGLIGPNGAGKTTLFNVITGFSPANSGQITFEGRPITRCRPHDIARRGIARTYQLVRPFYELTAIENIEVGIYFGRPRGAIKNGDVRAEALGLLDVVDLADKAACHVTDLNLGERKKLEIAKALAAMPRLILFDEVLAGLNPTETVRAVELFKKIGAMGITILMIEHNMQAIMSACQHIFVLHSGALIAQGTPQEVSQDSTVIEAYLGRRDLRLERRKRLPTHA
jgi:branched-chain amino acid transport system ATP-binding protein